MLGSLRPRQINKQTSIAVTSCSKDGCTALYVASEQGRREIAKLLLQRGADVNITGINGRTTLYIAFEMNNIKVARPFFFWFSCQYYTHQQWWLDAANISIIQGKYWRRSASAWARCRKNVRGNKGKTALMWAARNGHRTVIRLLLRHGASSDFQNRVDDNTLLEAAGTGQPVVTWPLLDAVAFDIKYNSSHTTLFCAAWKGDCEVIRFLLEHGSDSGSTNVRDSTSICRGSWWYGGCYASSGKGCVPLRQHASLTSQQNTTIPISWAAAREGCELGC